MPYIYVIGLWIVGIYLIYMAVKEYRILFIPAVYFLFLGAWRMADIYTSVSLMQGGYAWILRGISFVVMLITGILYYIVYRKKQ